MGGVSVKDVEVCDQQIYSLCVRTCDGSDFVFSPGAKVHQCLCRFLEEAGKAPNVRLPPFPRSSNCTILTNVAVQVRVDSLGERSSLNPVTGG